MELKLEGNYFEIRDEIKRLFPELVVKEPAPLPEECKELTELIYEEEYFSESKMGFILINEMDANHIVNALRIMLAKHSTKEVFQSDVFKSMILNLAEEIKTDVIEENYPF